MALGNTQWDWSRSVCRDLNQTLSDRKEVFRLYFVFWEHLLWNSIPIGLKAGWKWDTDRSRPDLYQVLSVKSWRCLNRRTATGETMKAKIFIGSWKSACCICRQNKFFLGGNVHLFNHMSQSLSDSVSLTSPKIKKQSSEIGSPRCCIGWSDCQAKNK